MHTVSPTKLRNNLFSELDAVLRGTTVRVKTKHGTAVILSEKQYEDLLLKEKEPVIDGPKIEGRIYGDLEIADLELVNYLELPES